MSMRTEIRKATRGIKKAFALPPDEESGDMDILDKLKEEHDKVRELLAKLQTTEGAAQRRSLVQQIKAALVPHTKAEEKVVYDAVIALRDKDAKVTGLEGYLEHEWASKTLQRLDKIANAASPEHKAAGKVLKELVEHHVKEEESNIWSEVEDNFTAEQRVRMNRDFEAAKKRVRVQ